MTRGWEYIISGLWIWTHSSITSVKNVVLNYKWNGKGLGMYNFRSLGIGPPTYYTKNIRKKEEKTTPLLFYCIIM